MWDWRNLVTTLLFQNTSDSSGKSKNVPFHFQCTGLWSWPDADEEEYLWAGQNFMNNKCGLQFTAPGSRMWVLLLLMLN